MKHSPIIIFIIHHFAFIISLVDVAGCGLYLTAAPDFALSRSRTWQRSSNNLRGSTINTALTGIHTTSTRTGARSVAAAGC